MLFSNVINNVNIYTECIISANLPLIIPHQDLSAYSLHLDLPNHQLMGRGAAEKSSSAIRWE